MAKFKPFRANKSDLPRIPIVDGQIIFTIDSYGIYIDYESERKEIKQIIPLRSSEREELISPAVGFYFETDTGNLLYYSGKWIIITQDYNILKNRPQINGITLQGNKSLHELGIQPEGEYLTEIPSANESTLGGICAKEKTNETVEVAIDPETHKIYVPAYPESYKQKHLYNKAVFIGDSTTQGWDNDNYSYVDIFEESGDFAEVVKLAQGGACLGPYQANAAGTGKSCIELIQSNIEEFTDADIVILQYCLNDIDALMAGKVQLGSHEDTSKNTTVVGYVKKILETLYSQNAHIKIYFLNLISDSDVFGALQSEKQAEYTYWHRYWMNIMRLIHEYGVQIINIMDDANFNYITNPAYTITSEYGTHLNTDGYRNVYHKIRASLDTETQRLYAAQPQDFILPVASGNQNTLPQNSYELIVQAHEIGKRIYLFFESEKVYLQLSEFGENIFGTQAVYDMDKPAIIRAKITPKDKLETTLTYINNNNVQPIYGKSVWIGDSIALGANNNNHSYIDIAQSSGLFESVRKYGADGATLGSYSIVDTGHSCYEQITNHISDIAEANMIFLEFGMNDLVAVASKKIVMGSPSDAESENTICGWIKKIFNKIYEINPLCKIYYLDLIATERLAAMIENRFTGKFDFDGKFMEIWMNWRDNATSTIRNYGIPIIYLFEDNGINEKISPSITSNDGMHPNNAGHKRIYDAIMARIDAQIGSYDSSENKFPVQIVNLLGYNSEDQTATSEKTSQEIYNDYQNGIITILREPVTPMSVMLSWYSPDMVSAFYTYFEDGLFTKRAIAIQGNSAYFAKEDFTAQKVNF